MVETKRYTKKEILRNRVIVFGGAALIIIIAVLLAVLLPAAVYPADYREQGPVASYDGKQYLTGRDIYDFTAAVPESSAADETALSSCLFIGGSHFEGLSLPSASVVYSRRASVQNGMDGSFVDNKTGKTASITDFIEIRGYDTVYLHFGMNEMAFANKAVFYNGYTAIVSAIKAARPDMAIYLCTVLPVTAAQDESGSEFNNTAAAAINAYISRIALEQGVFLLDLAAPYTDEQGNLSSDAALSGMYVKPTKYSLMRDYILSHIAPEYAR